MTNKPAHEHRPPSLKTSLAPLARAESRPPKNQPNFLRASEINDFLGLPWAFSALRPRFWRLDAKAVFPLLVWLLHWSWWTLGLALAGIFVLAVMDWTGLPPETCLGRLRCRALGDLRPLVDLAIYRQRAHW
jgi:intracellular multiplication protein IcmT